ncbi:MULTISPECIES: hypothetical protein [Isoptericola]|uniref:hypothetical protein n=1 Tax=Isoptericola TaxID=254250 RepID=UPI00383A1596
MPSVLVIVDRPFRGALERQFADSVHLARVAALQFGRASILLTGQGVLLGAAAVAAPAAPDEHVPGALAGAQSLLAAARDLTVLADARATEQHGVTEAVAELFEVASPQRVLEALTTHDHVWYA